MKNIVSFLKEESKSFTAKEKGELVLKSVGIYCAICILFFDTLQLFWLYPVFLFFYAKGQYPRYKKVQKARQLMEFKEFMVGLETGLSASYSLENSCQIAKEHVVKLYGEQCAMVKHCNKMLAQFKLHRGTNVVLEEFAKELDLVQATQLVFIINLAKKSGGNMVLMIQNATKKIVDTIEVKREIQVLIAAKSYEQKIMSLMPFGLVAYLRVSNPGYLDLYYHNFFGVLFMCICLGVIWVADRIGQQITDISI